MNEQLPIALDFLGVPDDDNAAPADGDGRRRQRATFLRRLIQTQSAARPLLLVIDDAHCLDPESESFVAEIVDALGYTHTLLLVNYRPGYRAEWMRVPYWREVSLASLNDDDVDALLLALVGDDPSTAAIRQDIRAAAGGNAFFVEELVQSLIDHDVLTDRDRAGAGDRVGGIGAVSVPVSVPVSNPARRRPNPTLLLRRQPDELLLPPNVQALLAARIDRLPQRDRLVVHTAAVIGRCFSAELLGRVLRSDLSEAPFGDGEVERMLDTLEAAAFIERERATAPAEYAFKHPLTQAVAYGAPLAETRDRMHLAVARALEQLHAERLGQHAAVIGHHYRAGGWTYEATRWRARAALQVTNITLARGRKRNG